MEVLSVVFGALASLLGALVGGWAALMAVRREARHAAELAAHERSATAASGLLSAISEYRLAVSREDSRNRNSGGWPIDRIVVGRLVVICDTQGAALTDPGLRFMVHQMSPLATMYIDGRNEDRFEWIEVERVQERAMDYLAHALGRHMRRQTVHSWSIMPWHDLEQLVSWSPPDQVPDLDTAG